MPRAHSTITFFQQQSTQTDPPQPEAPKDTQIAAFSVPRALSTFTYLNPKEKALLFFALDKSKTYTTLLMASKFVTPVKQAILTRLDAAPLLLKDALLAAAGGMVLDKSAETTELTHDMNYRRAATAMANFRSFTVTDSKELSLYTSLAIAVINFAEFVQETEPNFTICQHALNLIKPVFETQKDFDDDDDSVIAILIYLETTECFFRGQLPTLKYRICEGRSVSHALGLSLTLLPHLYELCSLSLSLSQIRDMESPAFETLLLSLDQIERDINRWRPNPPANFHELYTEGERMQILVQARFCF
jgi:hypothetical protein